MELLNILTLGSVYEGRMVELPDEKTPDRASDLENQQILEKEGNRILAKLAIVSM